VFIESSYLTGYIFEIVSISNSSGNPCNMDSTIYLKVSSYLDDPDSPPPEPPHKSKVSKSRSDSPISLDMSALACNPKTPGNVIEGNYFMNSTIDS
jgi:hypothetical protein